MTLTGYIAYNRLGMLVNECISNITNMTITGESSRCLENRVKECNSDINSAIYIHSKSDNHPHANIFYSKGIDQNSKHVAREARETIDIRINNLPLRHNRGNLYIPESSIAF